MTHRLDDGTPWFVRLSVRLRYQLAEGKSPEEALRWLKRRLSDAVYRCLVTDQQRDAAAA